MSTFRTRRLRIAASLAALIVAIPLSAQPRDRGPAGAAAARATEAGEETTATVAGSGMDSRETRQELSSLLDRFPPELGMVLKLDPTLLRNPSYLAAFPQLATFVAEHPEIAHHPEFFFEQVSSPILLDSRSPGAEMAMDVLGGIAGLSVFLVVTGVLAWLVKTLIAQRRWRHLSRVQTEVHNKLLDRFASSEELLAYIQTPAGKRFLESAPIPLEDGRTALGAPVGRILWSVQAGLVLVAAGIGLQLVRGGVPPEAAQPLFAIGIFVISIGVGFVVSAIVSFVISRKLGLWSPSSPAAAGGDQRTSQAG